MIVFEAKRDVFTQDAQVVVCTVNLVGVMGAGVAKGYKSRFPDAFTNYRRACYNNRFKIGMLLAQNLPNGQIGLCFPTKKHWKNGSELPWIEAGLIKFREWCISHQIKSVALTHLDVQTVVLIIKLKFVL